MLIHRQGVRVGVVCVCVCGGGGGYDTRLTASVLKQHQNTQMFQKDPYSN